MQQAPTAAQAAVVFWRFSPRWFFGGSRRGGFLAVLAAVVFWRLSPRWFFGGSRRDCFGSRWLLRFFGCLATLLL
jgi:hypothetical protein